MTRIAHLDLANGISGDMAISAFVAAGRSIGIDVASRVTAAIDSLDLGCSVTFLDDERGGIACIRTEIKTDDARHLPVDLRDAIARSDVDDITRGRALESLRTIIEAEAVVHGVDVEAVHLHELGSADTAADLVGVAAAVAALSVEDVTATSVPMPHGWITAEHGPLPLPAPVTLELLRGSSVRGVEGDKELVTPTGAAVLRTYVSRWAPLPPMELVAVGVGGGKRVSDVPNICRVLVGERHGTAARTEGCVLLETNIDDQTPEAIGYVVELLLTEGALDAWITHVTMKKSRPAFLLSALVRPEDEGRITETVFRHTTTLGIRRRETTRSVLDREIVTVDVNGWAVRVKIGRLGEEIVNVAPEFADCVEASRRSGVPVKTVYARALRASTGAG